MAGTGKGGLGTEETVSTGGLSRSVGEMRDLEVGTMVGEYKIDGVLGEGGMGKVFSALHPVIAKKAAIKVLHPELSMNREAVERFVQEARSVNQIGHPNIVDIFAFGALPDGRCYFVMEWLKGQSLRDRIRAAPLPIYSALSILETVSVALEAAHEKGIVHRDLKPDNIFLVDVKGTQPTVKLLDFGIAKLLGTDTDRVEKTRTGNLLGTPAYISPEQARGQSVDHRTDIYALGALAYELFTGSLPFPAETAVDMIAKHLYEQPPSARTLNPNLVPELDALVQRMLAKDPGHRPTLEQVRATLAPYRGGEYGAGPASYPGMPTPAPPMYTPHTPQPGMYAPNPYSTGLPPSQTSPPGMLPTATSAPGTTSVVGTSTGMPAKKSKAPLIVIGTLVAGVVGAALFFGVAGGGKDKAADKPTTSESQLPAADTHKATTPPVDPNAKTVARDPQPTTPAVDTTKPADPAKPADTTKPADPAKPADATAADAAKPAADAAKPAADATKPAVVKKPTSRPTRPKRPGTTTKPTKPTTDDDDAAM